MTLAAINLQQSEILTSHTSDILALAVSPDDSRIATGSFDGVVIISDVQGRAELRRYPGKRGFGHHVVCGVGLLSDPPRVVIARANGEVSIIRNGMHDVPDACIRYPHSAWRSLGMHTWIAMTTGRDPDRIVLGGSSGRVDLWTRDGDRLIQTTLGNCGTCITSVALSSRGDVAVGVARCGAYLISAGNPAVLRCLMKPDSPWYMKTGTLCFSSEGGLLAGGTSHGVLHLWDTTSGSEVARGHIDTCEITAVCVDPLGRYVATCARDAPMRLSTWPTLRPFWQEPSPQKGTDIRRVMGVSSTGSFIAVAGRRAAVQIWQVE